MLGLGFGLIVVGLVEIVMRLIFSDLSYEDCSRKLDPVNRIPLFEKYKRNGITHLRQSYYWFGPRNYTHRDYVLSSYAVPKPAGVKRIVCMGGSSTVGYPYGPRASFAKWLEIMLNASEVKYEVINCGINSLTSYGVSKFMPQALELEPDIIVVYMGHNDCSPFRRLYPMDNKAELYISISDAMLHSMIYRAFFERINFRFQKYQIERELYYGKLRLQGKRPEKFDPFWKEEERKLVRKNFQNNLDRIVAAAQTEKVVLALCTVQSNLRDYAPEGSSFIRGREDFDFQRFDTNFNTGYEALKSGNYESALEAFKNAAIIHPDHALLRYYRGKAFLGLGQYDAADVEFHMAAQLDDFSARAHGFVNDCIRSKRNQDYVKVVDIEKLTRSYSQGKIPGDDLFLDEVHPDIETQLLFASLIYQSLSRQGVLPLPKQDSLPVDRLVQEYRKSIQIGFICSHLLKLSTVQEELGRVKRAKFLNQKALYYLPRDEILLRNMERLDSQYQGIDTYE